MIESKSASALAEPSSIGPLDQRLDDRRSPACAVLGDGGGDVRLAPCRDERFELHGLRVVESHLAAARLDERLARRSCRGSAGRPCSARPAEDRFHQQLVLRREPAVDRAARQAGGLHDVHDLRAVVALRREDLGRGVEELRAERVVVRRVRRQRHRSVWRPPRTGG